MRIFILLAIAFSITSCSDKMKVKAGLSKEAPNEYEVRSHKPLEVPPHYEISK